MSVPPIQSHSATHVPDPFTSSQSTIPVMTLNYSAPLPPQAQASPHPSVTQVQVAPTILPYHSALPGAQGHPPHSTRTNAVENIGSNITSLVNQQCLAAAAVNLPSQVSLPQRTTRRRRCGPAISPPMLASTFSINSVLSNEGSSSALLRIKVKVYPPQVSLHSSLSSSS
jgi:hypothetical protein